MLYVVLIAFLVLYFLLAVLLESRICWLTFFATLLPLLLISGFTITFFAKNGLVEHLGYTSAGAILVGLVTLTSTIMWRRARHPYRSDDFGVGLSWGGVASFTLFTSLVGLQYYGSRDVPIFGWDVLEFWGNEVFKLIRAKSHCGPDCDFELLSDHRHPWVFIATQSDWVMATDLVSPTRSLRALYAFIMLCFLGVLYNFARLFGGHLYSAVVTLLLCFSIPLVENHVLIVGYADLPLAAITASAVACFAAFLCNGQRSSLLSFILVVTSLSLVKNSGTGLAAMILSCALLAHIFLRFSDRKGALREIFPLEPRLVSALTCIVVVLVPGFVALLLTDYQITIGGWEQRLQFNALSSVFSAEHVSLAKNSSFSLLAAATLISLFQAFGLMSPERLHGVVISRDAKIRLAIIFFLVFCTVTLWASQFWFQVLTPHGYYYAQPSHDTGGSRFKLPLALTSFLMVLAVQSPKLSTRRPYHGGDE